MTRFLKSMKRGLSECDATYFRFSSSDNVQVGFGYLNNQFYYIWILVTCCVVERLLAVELRHLIFFESITRNDFILC